MNIEQEITSFFNDKYEKYKKDIIEVLCNFLGEEYRQTITKKVNNLSIVYFVNHRNVKTCLKNEKSSL